MRLLGWIAVGAVLVGGCARAPHARVTALLQDARECEEDADDQLRKAGQSDNTVRILFFQSCMTLRGWQGH